MRKIISFTHMSLDGYISGPNGEMEWIVYNDELARDASTLSHNADAALYGRVTYQMMEGYWPTVPGNPGSTPQEIDHANWIEKIPKVVFSRTLQEVTWNNTTLIRENLAERVAALKAEPGENMLIFGSPRLTHALARLGLVDEYRINLNPVTIGQGVPLFEQGYAANSLNLVRSDRFDCGVIALLYEVVR